MRTAPWPDRLLTLAEFDELSGGAVQRHELQEGVPVPAQSPELPHQLAVFQVMRAMDRQLPTGFQSIHAAPVVTQAEFPGSMRVPDVVVVPKGEARRFNADQVLLAIEILSPATHGTDTVRKPFEYAKAGIGNYWIIDLTAPVSLTAYGLGDDGAYQQAAPVTGTFEATEPFPLNIDLREVAQ
ncbi:MAG: Uma2 family endonuclease [Kibdelosporangium sp.]